MRQIAKLHKDFPAYLFYPDGRIQSIRPTYYHSHIGHEIENRMYMKFISARVHPQYGLKFANIQDKNGKKRTIHIHKMVATLFVPKPSPKYKFPIFKDNDKNNVYYTNLKWVKDQGDLNYIQQANGTRDMVKQAAIMRKKRKKNNPKKWK